MHLMAAARCRRPSDLEQRGSTALHVVLNGVAAAKL